MEDANDALIQRFYAAFAAHDGDAMAACYTPDATFSDPVFTDLKGEEPGAMWRMLTGRADDLEVDLVDHGAAGTVGHARWIARYTFTQTGRKVRNDVRSQFTFRDGLIAEQQDSFSFHAWSRQALGPVGLLLGWAPPVKGGVQKKARAGLDEFMAGGGRE